MLTKFVTEVTTRFNPFAAGARSARLFLSQIPPKSRQQGMVINTIVLPRLSQEPVSLQVKFKDGKVMDFDCSKLNIKSLTEEVDRHSRSLQKKEDLSE